MEAVELKQTNQLAVGDTLVSATGSVYEVTRVARVGRGIRVQYVTSAGRQGRFTAAPDAVMRVRRLGSLQAA